MYSKFSKLASLLFISLMVFANMSFVAFAAPAVDGAAELPAIGGDGGTVLPNTEKDVAECLPLMIEVKMDKATARKVIVDRSSLPSGGSYTDILACGIKTGDIPLWMVPFYVRYLLEFIIGLAGVASVGGIIVGGFMYLFAGLAQDKDKGKNAIKNSIIGLVLTLSAWAIVNVFMALVSI